MPSSNPSSSRKLFNVQEPSHMMWCSPTEHLNPEQDITVFTAALEDNLSANTSTVLKFFNSKLISHVPIIMHFLKQITCSPFNLYTSLLQDAYNPQTSYLLSTDIMSL
jgi:hypothetical protein